MDPNVFRQEIITSLEIELAVLKAIPATDQLSTPVLESFRDQMLYLADTAKTIINLQK